MLDRRQYTEDIIERLAVAMLQWTMAQDPAEMTSSETAAHEHFRGLARCALSTLMDMTDEEKP